MGLLIVLAGLLIVAATALAALSRVRLDDGPAGVEWERTGQRNRRG
jgi:hypothetical protein